jgi:hypothetical protein
MPYHTDIGCLTHSSSQRRTHQGRGLTLIPFTPSLKSLVIAMFVGLAGCGGGDPDPEERTEKIDPPKCEHHHCR